MDFMPKFGGPWAQHPPPEPPFQSPNPDKKGAEVLSFGFPIHLHACCSHQKNCCRDMKQTKLVLQGTRSSQVHKLP
eukprot:scaffold63338_cov19-Tisochrysis_lutea.AAC.1